MRIGRLFLLMFAVLVVCSQMALAEKWESKQWHCSVDLPSGWVVASSDEVSEVTARIKKQLGARADKIDYVSGFYQKGGRLGGYPYVLVQPISFEGHAASYADIEKAMNLQGQVKELEGSFKDVAKNLSVGSAALDRAKNRVIMRMQMEVMGIGPVVGISTGHLTREGVVFLHCYDRQVNFDSMLPTFATINDGFQVDAGHDFVPSSFNWSGARGGAIIGGIVGAVIGLLGKLVLGKKKE